MSQDKPHRVVNGIPLHRNPVLFPPRRTGAGTKLATFTTPFPSTALTLAFQNLIGFMSADLGIVWGPNVNSSSTMAFTNAIGADITVVQNELNTVVTATNQL